MGPLRPAVVMGITPLNQMAPRNALWVSLIRRPVAFRTVQSEPGHASRRRRRVRARNAPVSRAIYSVPFTVPRLASARPVVTIPGLLVRDRGALQAATLV